MTDQQHPITPPPELVEEWRTAPEYASNREMLMMVSMTTRRLQEIADQAAQWGSDQELDACCEFETKCYGEDYAAKLRRYRRPQPKSRKHSITPPHDQVYWWWEEACKRTPSSFYEKLDYVATKAAEWGWQQRDASVVDELQKARDEELEECCEHISDWYEAPEFRVTQLRAARRPKSQSRKQRALDALAQIEDQYLSAELAAEIRQALERLQELEGQGDG